ncbi:MAG: SdpI family protein, partial [Deltaproteobacteria bacterium]|nr:SdpI family protein [Deltaproteobacteria bacterium]
MNRTALSHLIAGILIVVVSLPLIRRKIGRNRFYGIRVPAAFESEERWREINAYGGRLFLRWGIVVTLIGLAGLALPPHLWDIYALGSLVVI